MTESVRAVRASVPIGSLTVDGFMLPDGSYRMSQTKAAEAAGLSRRNLSDFLLSNALKSLLVKVTRVRFLSAKKSKSSLSLVVGGKVGFCPSLQKLPALTGCGKLTGGTKPP
jgi:hypothetical protein